MYREENSLLTCLFQSVTTSNRLDSLSTTLINNYILKLCTVAKMTGTGCCITKDTQTVITCWCHFMLMLWTVDPINFGHICSLSQKCMSDTKKGHDDSDQNHRTEMSQPVTSIFFFVSHYSPSSSFRSFILPA